jgi:hypothetical protein
MNVTSTPISRQGPGDINALIVRILDRKKLEFRIIERRQVMLQ